MLLLTTRRASSLAAKPTASGGASPFKARVTLGGKLEALLQEAPGADDPRASEKLAAWFRGKSRVVALTGAGLSTDSGIPDYRGAEGSYRKGHTPVSHDEFMRVDAKRKRYWARALVGYDAFRAAAPNAGHAALADLERRGTISAVITQNVDGLHEAAGSRNVIPLHGRGYRVRCTSCGAEGCRSAYHADLGAATGVRGARRCALAPGRWTRCGPTATRT
ncbi:lipoamidase [Aureococcus anophagefferens]|nr:lipoamidase [Aureococcus anophagefferens]